MIDDGREERGQQGDGEHHQHHHHADHQQDSHADHQQHGQEGQQLHAHGDAHQHAHGDGQDPDQQDVSQAPLWRRRQVKKQVAFLKAFAETGTIAAAAKVTSTYPKTVWVWRRDDPAFRARFDAAVRAFVDVLEDEAIRRAVTGWDEPVYQKGERVGVVRRFSDRLLEVLLRAWSPARFRESTTSVAVQSSGPTAVAIAGEGVVFYLPANGRSDALSPAAEAEAPSDGNVIVRLPEQRPIENQRSPQNDGGDPK